MLAARITNMIYRHFNALPIEQRNEAFELPNNTPLSFIFYYIINLDSYNPTAYKLIWKFLVFDLCKSKKLATI